MRRQPPVHSPITAAGLREAAVRGFGLKPDPRGDLTDFLNREYRADRALLFGSGTQALQAAMLLAMRRLGDSSVALPAFTCFDVAAAAVGARALIRFYDVNPETLSPDLESLANVLARGARIVVIAPLYGMPVDWDAVDALLGRHDAIAVEDAAQGYQAKWRGRPVGSLAPLSVLSFGRGKGWTGGAGGALLLRGLGAYGGLEGRISERQSVADELHVLLRLIAQWALGRPRSYALPAAIPWLELGETIYHDPTPPRLMTRTAAACLRALRAAADREASARRANGLEIVQAIERGTQVRTIRTCVNADPGFLRLPVRLARGLAGFEDPARAVRLGVLPGYPRVLAALPQVWPLLETDGERWPGGEELARTLFTVPTHSLLTAHERNELIRLLREYRT